MLNLIRTEPVLFQAVIQAVIALLGSFEVHLSANQIGSIMALTAAILAFITRGMVTSHPNNPTLPSNGKTTDPKVP
jgi:hypothetical protein